MTIQERFDKLEKVVGGKRLLLFMLSDEDLRGWEDGDPAGRWLASVGRYESNRYTGLEVKHELRSYDLWGKGETPEAALENLISRYVNRAKEYTDACRKSLTDQTAALAQLLAVVESAGVKP